MARIVKVFANKEAICVVRITNHKYWVASGAMASYHSIHEMQRVGKLLSKMLGAAFEAAYMLSLSSILSLLFVQFLQKLRFADSAIQQFHLFCEHSVLFRV